MTYDVLLLGQGLRADQVRGKVVVVIDVLRACSTITTALANGARTVLPVADVGDAGRLVTHMDPATYVLGGERDALPIPDFPLGNSPREFAPEVVQGRTVILHTTNGASLFPAAVGAEMVVAGCLLNAQAVTTLLREIGRDVVLVCAGWKGRVSLEDTLCAGLLLHRLFDGQLPEEASDAARIAYALYAAEKHDLAAALRHSEHGRRLASLGHDADLAFCAEIDRYADLLPTYDGSGLKLG